MTIVKSQGTSNVTCSNNYDFVGDKLIIGNFFALLTGVMFIMSGANHRMGNLTSFPFAATKKYKIVANLLAFLFLVYAAMVHGQEDAPAILATLMKQSPKSLNLDEIIKNGKLDEVRAGYEAYLIGQKAQLLRDFPATIAKKVWNGVSVLKITPAKEAADGEVIIYVHGGAFVFLSAASTLSTTLPLAAHTGYTVLSIDFQAAPEGTIDTMAEEVVKVVEALLASGQDPIFTGFLADSSGAIVLTQAINRLVKEGRRFWGAVYLSPWADITCVGDSFATLSDFDPILRVKDYLEVAATLAAGPKANDAALSMIRGTYPPSFPPSLIQVGSREIFLSQAVLTYQRMQEFGVDAEWELYDGMWHVFQATHPKLPASLSAWARVSKFFSEHKAKKSSL